MKVFTFVLSLPNSGSLLLIQSRFRQWVSRWAGSVLMVFVFSLTACGGGGNVNTTTTTAGTGNNFWTWVSGSDLVNQNGVYGIQNIADPSNVPGGRQAAVSWSETNGNLWLFGGFGHDVVATTNSRLNDLWKFDGSNWTWIKGSNLGNQLGVYGTQGTADPANIPGGRNGSVSWSDTNGNLWLFGGLGLDSNGASGDLNDLWKFDGSNWTWMAGSNLVNQPGVYGIQGTADPANHPGARQGAVSWSDTSDNFWLFGGKGLSSVTPGKPLLSDLWKFDGTNWTWVAGSNVQGLASSGIRGQAAATNVMGRRLDAVSWVDANGTFWVFGGGDNALSASGEKNDLWRYDLSLWFKDGDGDGFGDPSNGAGPLQPDNTWKANFADCNDADAAFSPDAIEINDMLDNDCDGQIDEDFRKYVFVTSSVYNGNNIGGLTAADTYCQNAAESVTPALPGNYAAWLSSSLEDARNHVTDDTNNSHIYVLPDNSQVARGFGELIDGSLDNAINLDEGGSPVTSTTTVWTGTNTLGVHDGNSCGGNWSASGIGGVGDRTINTSGWTSNATGNCTLDSARLYCFQL